MNILIFPVWKIAKPTNLFASPFVLTAYHSRANRVKRLLQEMPKAQPTKEKLRHVRYREQIGGKLPIPGKIELEVIGSGGYGTPRSVILSTDHVRYLFNCGEGTQRIASEHKFKLSRLENVFITHNSWNNIGGLLGLALTLEAINVPKITVHGPLKVEQSIRMAKSFAENSNICIEKREADMGIYEDTAFKIEYVSLLPNAIATERAKMCKLKENLTENSDPAPPKKMRFSVEELDAAMAFICTPHPARRRLNLEKCVDLGVPVGPLLGILKNETSVTLDNGTVIHPDQVLSEVEKPYSLLVLECPNINYLDALLSSESLASLQVENDDQRLPADVVVHMSGVEVISHPKYQKWMKRFPSSTSHLIVNESTSSVANFGSYKIQAMLNLLSPTIFPLLYHQRPENSKATTVNDSASEDSVQLASTNLKFFVRPRKGFNYDQCLELNNAEFIREAWKMKGFEKQLQEFHVKVKEHSQNLEKPMASKGPEILFLGTGSSVPSKRRNVSGILVQIEPDNYILLDCGEGTAGQLYRHYGEENSAHILRNLKAIFISHMHADHHMGLFGILRDRQKFIKNCKETVNPVLLLSPIQIRRWLNFYMSNIENLQQAVKLIPLQSILPHQSEVNREMLTEVLNALQLSKFVPVEVDHCKNAFGVVLAHTSDWSVVYSGDTMPCERLINAGQNCDLLIHEATMEDDLEEEAKIKTHSTTSQAIDVGMKMGAKFILLNHFSQRYSKIPIISDRFSEKVGISFDNMRVSLSDLPLLPHLNVPLKTLFAEDYAEMEEKIMKRFLRKNQDEMEATRPRDTDSTSSVH
ncbi:zinc phosphodiesterase ELAC protein 2 isoform X1 [Octopus bimaculoides]|uniref:Zinc phosphodiesterase ELAC protein 2 n=1 Tax=Octopus bimaculoides TaxID=37653 RepID=A0A0L8G350_OCTBM|nr:zinc phosphodiesterase ELAC protein 2 isoform X1 [Octopus bimaculoides]|eukprot:XP_014784508.1 PREDICTED: zinc phosphodiesterase ELAC protein 2-like isoform X1 [Octopus bimaculoides]